MLPCHLPPQNVADHLSSRAYMELASRFPARRRRQLAAAAAAERGGCAVGDIGALGGDGGGADAALQQPDGGWTSREDSVDWEAVRCSSQEELSDAIKCRGMQFRWVLV